MMGHAGIGNVDYFTMTAQPNSILFLLYHIKQTCHVTEKLFLPC